MKPIAIILLPALAASLLSCAPVTPAAVDGPSARQCFFVNQVRSFASADDRTVYVRTGQAEVFALSTIGCTGVDWSHQIGIRPRTGGSSICASMDAELIIPGLDGRQMTCQVTDVRRLTDAEAAALTSRERP